MSTHRYRLADWVIEPATNRIVRGETERHLEPRSMDVLVALLEAPGRVLSTEDLLDRAWPDRVVEPGAVARCINQIRRALGDDPRRPRYIETIWKRGYRTVARVEAGEPPRVGEGSKVSRRTMAFGVIVASLSIAATWVGFAGPSFTALDQAAQDAPREGVRLAVLPFEDLSPRGNQRYLADGIAEEILNLLTRVPGLRVTARSSSFALGDAANVGEAREILGVAYLVQGSLHKLDDQLRITVALVDTGSGSQVWSRSYESNSRQVFEIQGEIASAVAESLHLSLAERAELSTRYDPHAYEHYLKAQHFWHRRSPGDVERARRGLEQAVTRDPDLAPAWAALAGVYNALLVNDQIDQALGLERLRAAVERALDLAPGSAAVHIRAARYYRFVGDDDESLRHWQQAVTLDPDNWLVLAGRARRALDRGDYVSAVDYLRRQVAINPLSAIGRVNLAHYLMAAGSYREAQSQLQEAIALNPEWEAEQRWLHTLLSYLQGHHRQALAEAVAQPDCAERDQLLALIHRALGNQDESRAALARLESRPGLETPIRTAEVLAHWGDTDGALERLDQLADIASANLAERLRISPLLATLRADVRWERSIARFGSSAGRTQARDYNEA